MTIEITPQDLLITFAILCVVVGSTISYLMGRTFERARWVIASERLGTEKTVITIKDTQYLVLQSDEYQQVMNIFTEEP